MKSGKTAEMVNKRQAAFLKGRPAAVTFAFIVCFASVPLLFAQGGRPGDIFNFGAGARPLAMGGAYTAASSDASAVYYNPSGLGMLAGRNVAVMHSTLFEGAVYDYVGYAQNFGRLPGGWGLQVLRLSAGSAEGRDEFNNPAPSFSYSENAFSLGAGLRGVFLPMLSFGAGAKLTSRTLAGSSDRLVGLDLGLQYGPLIRGRLNFGLVMQNAASFNSGDTSDKLKLALKAGTAYTALPGLILAADVSDSGEFRVGTEYAMGPAALRAGYGSQAASFGGGIKFLKSYQFDVAMLKHEALGMSNRVSVNYYFGGFNKASRSEVYAGNYLDKAGEDIRNGDYVKALENAEMAAGLDPNVRKGPWGEKQLRLASIVKGLRLKELPQRQNILKTRGEQPDEANRALAEYLGGNGRKSALLAHSALGYARSEAFYGELLSMLVRLTSFELRADEILPRPAMIQEKLNKAAAVFYEQRFESALLQCEEILLLDEKNATAWTRLGSVHYAMGDREKARKTYEKALQLDPSDQQTVDFMKMQGWR